MTTIIILTRFDCDTEGLTEQVMEKIVGYLGKRTLASEPDPNCPAIRLNYSPTPEERIEILSFASQDKQQIFFFEGSLPEKGESIGII